VRIYYILYLPVSQAIQIFSCESRRGKAVLRKEPPFDRIFISNLQYSWV